MIEFASLVYLDLQKTASSRLITVLERILDESPRRPGRHLPIDRARPGKPVLCSIRNPWDWYVSIWAYGCRGEGALRSLLLALRPAAAELYADGEDPALFRRFVDLLWQASTTQPELGRALLPIPDLAGVGGLLTARLAWIAVPDACSHFTGTHDPAELARRFDAGSQVTHFLRQESWAADLTSFCAESLALRLRADWQQVIASEEHVRVNASPRRAYQDYYDEDARQRVAALEAFVVDRFGYRYR